MSDPESTSSLHRSSCIAHNDRQLQCHSSRELEVEDGSKLEVVSHVILLVVGFTLEYTTEYNIGTIVEVLPR